jgi:hypothetical protein
VTVEPGHRGEPAICIKHCTEEYSINRVPSHEQDVAFQWEQHDKEKARSEQNRRREQLRVSALRQQWNDSETGKRYAEKQRLDRERSAAQQAFRAANGGKMVFTFKEED